MMYVCVCLSFCPSVCLSVCMIVASKQNSSKSKSYERVSMKFLERWRVVQASDFDDDPITPPICHHFTPCSEISCNVK